MIKLTKTECDLFKRAADLHVLLINDLELAREIFDALPRDDDARYYKIDWVFHEWLANVGYAWGACSTYGVTGYYPYSKFDLNDTLQNLSATVVQWNEAREAKTADQMIV